MTKDNLKNYLNIIIGELKNDIDCEEGTFDEIATNAFKKALTCKDILCKDSKTTMIQFDKSVEVNDDTIGYTWIDGVVQDCNDTTHIFFSTSNEDDVFNTELYEIERKYIIEIIKQVIQLCNF